MGVVTRRAGSQGAAMSRLLLALLAVTALALPAGAQAAAPQPQVVGNRLVDAATGQAFVPRGVNWSSFEYACFYGYAYHDSSESGSVNPDAAGARVIAGWHVNTVRVPLNQDCWLGEDASPSFGTVGGYRQAVQDWVNTLHAAGMAVILDLHWSGPAGVKADGQRAMADDRSDDFWTSVAETFKADPMVMFDVFNEPYTRYADNGSLVFDLTWSCWRAGGCPAPTVNDQQAPTGATFTTLGMQQLVAAIRATGARQPIMLGGRDYANDLGEWLANRPPDDQLVASFHNYNGQVCHTVACWDQTIAPVAAQVPVVTGEFGETDCGDGLLNGYMDWADRHGVGYLAWGWWVLVKEPQCSTLALLADQQGTPRAPNGTALKAHLDALARTTGNGTGSIGVGGSVGSQPSSSDTAAPRLKLGGKTRQKLGRAASVTVRCSEACSARATGLLAISDRRGADERRLIAAKGRAAAGKAITLRLKLSARTRRLAALALRRHGKVVATITVKATDAVKNAVSVRRRVRLVR
jgi:hypothetical protein